MNRRFTRLIVIAGFAVPIAMRPVIAGDNNIPLAAYDAKITKANRQYWAYQPIRRPAIPRLRNVV